MKKIVYKSKAIQTVILMVALCLLVSLWPLRVWNKTVTQSIEQQTGTTTQVVDNDRVVLQSFVAQYDHLDTIRLYLGEETTGESFFVRLLNEGQVMIAEEEIEIDRGNLPGYVEVLIDVDTEVGKMYHCIVQGKDSAVFLGCELIPMTDMPYAGLLYYDNATQDGMNLVADYNYGVPLRKGKVLMFGAIIAVIAVLLYSLVGWYYKKKKENDKLITVESMFKKIANPVTAIFTVVCLVAVLMGACGKYLLDNTFFFISVLLLAGILFYGINHSRDGQEPILTWDYIKSHFSDLLQSICLAGAIGGCCEYMAGLYDIHHAVAERKEMLWFALAVIVMFKWKEIFNLYNLVYLVVAGIFGYHYYQNGVVQLAEKAIKETEIDMNLSVLRNTVLIAILLGLILIRTIKGLIQKKLARPNFVYAGLLVVFFAAITIFRNGRWWTVVMAVSFTLFYLTYGMWEHKERFLVNLCRGVILQFMYATGFALLHRPYTTYRTARYPHMFHTVTITATYLTIVECAALVMVLSKLRKSSKLRDAWKELVLFGVVSSYMIFTVARTGFFAVGVTVLFGLVIMAAGKGKEKLKNFGKSLGMLILAVLVCFPVTFTVQRTVPALVSEPYMYEFENFTDDTLRGRKLDSVEFMRVGRFIDVFTDKILGIPEGTFDIYGEIAEYRSTHDSEGNENAKTVTNRAENSNTFNMDAEEVLVVSADPLSADMLKSADIEDLPEEYQTDEEDYTNGRLDIFRSYIEQMNMTGHEEMGALLSDGSIATHAHDIYLQVAYDHGIPVGILFVLVGLGTFVRACVYFGRKKDEISYAAMPAVVTVAVAVAGIVEWLFHLSHPCGFVLMLVITPLVFCEGKTKVEGNYEQRS